jgi:hypothetical protein
LKPEDEGFWGQDSGAVYKLQGEASFCDQKTLNGDIIDAFKKKRGI